MREIKFRAWDRKNKVMRDVKGLIWKETNLIAHCLPKGHEFNEWFTVTLDGNEYQLMQYTGLKDMNGNEIYEGDIYRYKYYFDGKRYEYRHIVVEWGTTYIAYEGVFHGYELDDEYIEVVGNIYENEELLNER